MHLAETPLSHLMHLAEALLGHLMHLCRALARMHLLAAGPRLLFASTTPTQKKSGQSWSTALCLRAQLLKNPSGRCCAGDGSASPRICRQVYRPTIRWAI
jgi:hypothetical protein